jgi:hypothetical protein
MKRKAVLTLLVALAFVSFLGFTGTKAEATSSYAESSVTIGLGEVFFTNIVAGSLSYGAIYSMALGDLTASPNNTLSGYPVNGVVGSLTTVGPSSGFAFQASEQSYSYTATVPTTGPAVAFEARSWGSNGTGGNWYNLGSPSPSPVPSSSGGNPGSWITISGIFQAQNQGLVSLSIPWATFMSLTAGTDPGSYAAGYYMVSLAVGKGGGSGSDESNFVQVVPYGYPAQMSFTSTDSGTVGGKKTYSAGEFGEFTINLQSYSAANTPVPIPGALWLLGSGLVGLVGIRRRFWK